MKDGGGVTYYGFSGRHVRLKYQACVTAIGVCLLAFLTVDKIKIPGFLEFADKPALWIIELGLICFAVFSIFSFYSQTQIERKHIPLTVRLFRNEIERQKDKLLPKVRTLTGDEFDRYQKAIIPEVKNLKIDIAKLEDFALKWQPTSQHFYDVQTETAFAIEQIKSFEESVKKEIYQGSHGYDTHYQTSLVSFEKYLDEIIELMWRPNDFLKEKGNLELLSVITGDLKIVNSLAELIPNQCQNLLDDLNDHLKLRRTNQEVLSVGIPFLFSIGATSFGTIFIGIRYIKDYVCH